MTIAGRAAVDHPIQQRDEAIDIMHLAARSRLVDGEHLRRASSSLPLLTALVEPEAVVAVTRHDRPWPRAELRTA
jgi:hypothetical protein